MKYFKAMLVVVAVVVLGLLLSANTGFPNFLIEKDNTLIHTNSNSSLLQHGDIWFAFTAIGAIGIYLITKK